MTKLPEDFKARWIGALRTGDFKQGRSMLYNADNNTYCCLGVAAVCDGISLDELKGLGYTNGIDESLKTDGLIALRPYEDTFATLNDSKGLSFSEIADIIEQDY